MLNVEVDVPFSIVVDMFYNPKISKIVVVVGKKGLTTLQSRYLKQYIDIFIMIMKLVFLDVKL